MRKILISAVFLIMCVLGCFSACNGKGNTDTPGGDTEAKDMTASVMSINIAGQDMTTSEYINTPKYNGQTGEDYTYALRRRRLDTLIDKYEPDVLLLQEVNGNDWWWPHLVSNEDSFLNTFTQYTLVGRTSRLGSTDGEGKSWDELYNQLYYNNQKFEEVASGLFYLTNRRTEPFSKTYYESIVYSSDDTNTCVWAVLRDKQTGTKAIYASTHLKTSPTLARSIINYKQALQLVDGLYELAEYYGDENGAIPIVVGGDFNMSTDQDYNETYSYMLESGYQDAQKIAAKTDKAGTARVWGKNLLPTKNDGSNSDGYRIDYFFSQGMQIDEYDVLNGTFAEDDGTCIYYATPNDDGSEYDLSDHLPIYIECTVPSGARSVQPPAAQLVTENNVNANPVTAEGATVTASSIKFDGTELLQYVSTQFLDASIVSVGGNKMLSLVASECSPNLFADIDYAKLMQDKGLTAIDLDEYSKVVIRYNTYFKVEGELMLSAVAGGKAVNYGSNTTVFSTANGNRKTVTLSLKKDDNSTGSLGKLRIGTMGYKYDISGVCGMYKGDTIYVESIEFIA